jgi:hypothetical protein
MGAVTRPGSTMSVEGGGLSKKMFALSLLPRLPNRRGQDGDVIVDLLDPHDLHFAAAAPRAVGIARSLR